MNFAVVLEGVPEGPFLQARAMACGSNPRALPDLGDAAGSGNREAVHERPDGQPCGLRLPDLAGPATRKRALKAVGVVEG